MEAGCVRVCVVVGGLVSGAAGRTGHARQAQERGSSGPGNRCYAVRTTAAARDEGLGPSTYNGTRGHKTESLKKAVRRNGQHVCEVKQKGEGEREWDRSS